MTDTDNERPLWERLREAADVLDEAVQRDPWDAPRLDTAAIRVSADAMERDADAAASRDQLIDDLAATVYRAMQNLAGGAEPWNDLPADSLRRRHYRNVAKDLMMRYDIKQVEVPF
jgi:glucose-6-phosphate-specific signal transduction histidine kinase